MSSHPLVDACHVRFGARPAGLGGMLSLSNRLATAGISSRSSGFTRGTGAGMDTDQTDEPAAVGWRFRTPPGWPEQPVGWRPPAGWAPDPQWPPAPSGWQFWEFDTEHPGSYAATPQAEPSVQPSTAYDAAQAQPIANWAARPRQNQGLGTALLVLGALVVLSDIFRAATAPAAVHAYEAAAAEGRDPAQVITAYGAAGLLYFLMLPTWIVGSLWLSRARENAVLIAPDQVRRSAVWAWLGWWAPIVFLWFPKQIVDDSWQITSSAAAVGQRVRDRDTTLWWVLWIAYVVAGNLAGNSSLQEGIMGSDVHQGVVPALEIAVAILGILAFAAWVPVVRGLSQAQTELARSYGSVVTPLDEKVSGAALVDWAAFQPWEYRPDAGFAEGTDLIGYTVVAVDGDVGHVEATYDRRPAYLEVKAWSFFGGREVMVPAGLVERIGSTEKKVYVDRTRDQIKDAPRYGQAPADYWERLGSYYSGTYMPPGDQPWQLYRDSSSR